MLVRTRLCAITGSQGVSTLAVRSRLHCRQRHPVTMPPKGPAQESRRLPQHQSENVKVGPRKQIFIRIAEEQSTSVQARLMQSNPLLKENGSCQIG
uniref:Uncharacterized protein n=1 Tax=Caenorhabditis japonica TaxID=281687 RepID=A0A8R1IUJ5_CAEJA